jgi:hypothetical protein
MLKRSRAVLGLWIFKGLKKKFTGIDGGALKAYNRLVGVGV